MKKILIAVLCVAFTACSTSSKSFKPDSVKADEGVASGMSACGTHEVIIVYEPSEIKKKYSAIDPAHTNFHTSVITAPK